MPPLMYLPALPSLSAVPEDDGEDDIEEVGEDVDIDDEDDDEGESEDVVVVSATGEVFSIATLDEIPEPESEPEPETAPMTGAPMAVSTEGQGEAQLVTDESPFLTPLHSPLVTSGGAAAPAGEPTYRSRDSPAETMVDVPLPTHTPAHVTQTERALQLAKVDSFKSTVKWTVASLTQVLTYELEDMCAKAATTSPTSGSPSLTVNQQQQQQQFRCFNSSVRPPFELNHYIRQLVSCANCSASTFIVMLVYLERVQQRCEYLQLTELNVHRVVLAALLAAIKWVDDEVCRNEAYASIGGVSAHELNRLELMFNQAADWTFFVPADVYRRYENGLLEKWGRAGAQGRRVVIS